MLKWITISLFIGLILFKPVAQFSWEVWYAVNLEYVAEELCENKEEPEMECDGKCYLKKQLVTVEVQEQEDPSQEHRVNPFQAKEEPTVTRENFEYLLNPIILESKESHFRYVCKSYTAFQLDIFHPPQKLS